MHWLYLNGDLVRRNEATVWALDRAFFHGRALVETFCARGGGVFRLAQHYERLCNGGPVLGIDIALTLTNIEAAIAGVLQRNETEDARLRLTVTAGAEGSAPNVTLMASPLTDYPPEVYERGMHATVADVRRNETSPLSRIKCAAGLLDGVLARECARASGFDEAIMLNTRGLIAEATVANVFVLKGGCLLTPPVEAGALPGVTRAAVLDFAREAGAEAADTDLSLDDLRGADEAFLSNAVMGVMPLTRLDGAPIAAGVGRVTQELRRRYAEAALAVA